MIAEQEIGKRYLTVLDLNFVLSQLKSAEDSAKQCNFKTVVYNI